MMNKILIGLLILFLLSTSLSCAKIKMKMESKRFFKQGKEYQETGQTEKAKRKYLKSLFMNPSNKKTVMALRDIPVTTYTGKSSDEPPELIKVERHVVKSGDTLWKIARRWYKNGELYPLIVEYNLIDDPGNIGVGDILKIPIYANLVRCEIIYRRCINEFKKSRYIKSSDCFINLWKDNNISYLNNNMEECLDIRKSSHYNAGISLYREGNYKKAIYYLTILERLDPGYKDISSYIERCNDCIKAEAILKTGIGGFETKDYVAANKDFGEAKRLCSELKNVDKWIDKVKREYSILFEKARNYYEREEYDQAEDILKDMINHAPVLPSNGTKEVAALLEKTEEINRHKKRGLDSENQKRYEEAFDEYSKILNINNNSQWAGDRQKRLIEEYLLGIAKRKLDEEMKICESHKLVQKMLSVDAKEEVLRKINILKQKIEAITMNPCP